MRNLSFTSLITTIVLLALLTVVLLLLIPAYHGSQQALLKEIELTHQRDEQILEQFLSKFLLSAQYTAEELSQRHELISALQKNDIKQAERFLQQQVNSGTNESIHALTLSLSGSDQSLSVYNTSLLHLSLPLEKSTKGHNAFGQWTLSNLKEQESYYLLKVSYPVISQTFGEVIATLHSFILLNDNFAIVSEIQNLTGADAVGLYYKRGLITKLSFNSNSEQRLTTIKPNQDFVAGENEQTLYQHSFNINQNDKLTVRYALPNHGLQLLRQAYSDNLGPSLIVVAIIVIIVVYLLTQLIRASLIKLVRYADHMAEAQEPAPFNPGSFTEFNKLGSTLEHMANRIGEHEQQINGIIENTPNIIFIKGADLRYQMVSPNYAELLQCTVEEILHHTDKEIHPPAHAEFLRSSDIRIIQRRQSEQIEYSIRTPQGKRDFLSTKFPLFDDRGFVYAIGGIATDITDLKNARADIQLAGQVFEQAGEAILVVKTNFELISANTACQQLSGYHQDEISILAKNIFDDHPEIDQTMRVHTRWQSEGLLHHKDGTPFPVWLSVSRINHTDDEICYVILFTDITELKNAESKLDKLANYDTLTGLPNRTLFFERLEHSLLKSQKQSSKSALLLINVDRFKNINETYGHKVGDSLLIETAQRIKSHLRQEDTVSRLGADEFAVLLHNVHSIESVSFITHRIQQTLREPFELDNFTGSAPSSIGIAIYPDDGVDAKLLLSHADTALNHVKNRGRNAIQFYDQALNIQAEARTRLEEDLRQAQQNGELFLHYQPRYHIDGETILSAEALARWQHPEKGMVPPDQFITLAEQTGQIVELGRFILETACTAAKSWNSDPDWPVPVSVNLSARQIYDPRLIDDITTALEKSELPPHLLELEITETLAIEDLDAVIDKLTQIRNMGIRFSVDDFGTGYSSLIYLKRLPVDTVKIDRSFITGIPGDADDEKIVSAIISMSHSLQLTVVAEGVETENQLQFLREHHCDEIQGYLLGKPGPADIMREFCVKQIDSDRYDRQSL